MTTAPEPRYTERGFRDYAELVDRYGSTVTVRESSNALTDCVWIFCKNDVHPGMHLTVDQARIVRDALTEFIDEFADDVPDLLAEVDRLTADRDSWKNATDATGLALGEVNRQRGEAQDRANAAEAEVARLTSALDRAEAERDTIMDGLIRLHSVVTPIEQTNAAVAMVMSATTTLLRKHGVFGPPIPLSEEADHGH